MDRRVGIARASRMLLTVLAASAVLVLGVAASASAGTLDQQQTASNTDAGLFSAQSVAQTFTPGLTGRLDQVDLLLLKVGTPPGPSVTAEIRGVSGVSPGAAPLATTSIPISSVGTTQAFLSFTFASPASVTAGTKYSIVVYSPGAGGNAVGSRYQNSDVYSGGAMFFDATEPIPPGSAWGPNATSDMAFKTYVAPPLPSTPSGGAGVAPKKLCKHKKKHKSGAVIAKKCKKKKKKK
jgi:hypothetical protein